MHVVDRQTQGTEARSTGIRMCLLHVDLVQRLPDRSRRTLGDSAKAGSDLGVLLHDRTVVYEIGLEAKPIRFQPIEVTHGGVTPDQQLVLTNTQLLCQGLQRGGLRGS